MNIHPAGDKQKHFITQNSPNKASKNRSNAKDKSQRAI